MKLREIMTKNVVRIRPDEPVAVAARALAQYNIGALPVCGYDGRLRGLVTDRAAGGAGPGLARLYIAHCIKLMQINLINFFMAIK